MPARLHVFPRRRKPGPSLDGPAPDPLPPAALDLRRLERLFGPIPLAPELVAELTERAEAETHEREED